MNIVLCFVGGLYVGMSALVCEAVWRGFRDDPELLKDADLELRMWAWWYLFVATVGWPVILLVLAIRRKS